MIELVDSYQEFASIKVIGVGGGGSNAVNHMAKCQIEGVEFICANTDAQALRRLSVETIVQLGVKLTKGLGAGTDYEIGRLAAEEAKERLIEALQGADMLFLTAGMGGGTGTGAIPVIAKLAQQLGILTVAVVTKPFLFEGQKKQSVAELGIRELETVVDSLIVIPNQKLLPVLGDKVSLITAFKAANDVLLDAVQGITELIVHPGLINVDFADVRTVMSGMGASIMGVGIASGEHRARLAAEKAIACPLLEDINLQGARGILVNICAADMIVFEFDEVGQIVHGFASENAIIKIGMAVDENLGDALKVTVVVTGMNAVLAKSGSAADVRQVLMAEKETLIAQKREVDVDNDYLDIPAFLRRQVD